MSGVYFIRIREDGPIKIGFTKLDPLKRLAQLQPGFPWELHLLGHVAAPKSFEVRLHGILAPFRMRGEWFEPSPTVINCIARILSPAFSWTPVNDLDRALALAGGSQCSLSNAIGFSQRAISVAHTTGKMSARFHARVRSYLEETSA